MAEEGVEVLASASEASGPVSSDTEDGPSNVERETTNDIEEVAPTQDDQILVINKKEEEAAKEPEE